MNPVWKRTAKIASLIKRGVQARAEVRPVRDNPTGPTPTTMPLMTAIAGYRELKAVAIKAVTAIVVFATELFHHLQINLDAGPAR